MLYAEYFYNVRPGVVIRKMLDKMGMNQAQLAAMVNCRPQELNSIIQCRRPMPLELGLRIEPILGMEEGFFGKLQLHNKIREIKQAEIKRQTDSPPAIRKILFWDSDFSRIDWDKSKYFVIKRVEKYGTKEEVAEIKNYYGIS